MFVKICGTTNLEDARLAADLGADALGFIFAPSKRQVTVQEAAAITSQIPAHVQRVGVFAEPLIHRLEEAVHAAGLTTIQMHWTPDPEATQAVAQALGKGVQLWQVVGYQLQSADTAAAEAAFVRQLTRSLSDERLSGVLLDTVTGTRSGGSGVPFPWSRAATLVSAAQKAAAQETAGTHSLRPLILAGGLRPENVAEAIAAMSPWGVDVVSGVEAAPGRKDPERVAALFDAARRPR